MLGFTTKFCVSNWLYDNLKCFCKSQPKQRKDNGQWYFQTRSLPELQKYGKLFYKGKKIVPQNIDKLLISSLGLAIWYMDDGSLDYRPKDHYNFSLTTNSFSLEENWLLVKTLKKNFGIEANVHTPLCRGKRYPEIYIGARGRDKFLELIKPHILHCFRRKLPPFCINPSETEVIKPR
jgi:hypothetical protein